MPYTNIDDPTLYFNTVLYTGNGSTQSITGIGFQPDLVWIKERGGVADHFLCDAVRGATKYILSNANIAEGTNANTLTAFVADGFNLGTDGWTNNNSDTYASWNWLADNTSGSSNTDGSITSTVAKNTTSGFSIVRYSGTGSLATVGHGLGVAPSAIFFKRLDTTGGWASYHKPLGATLYMRLDSTQAQTTATDEFNNTEPTSAVFTVQTDGSVNASGTNNMIAYCFAEKKGFSKFGKYTGNSSADGTFVYTGFKPAFIMVKATNGIEAWFMLDNKRANSFNAVNGRLRANGSDAEETNVVVCDFVSNGFKFRFSDGGWNSSSYTYIYMAFAENPFTTSTGIPTTAR